MEEKQVSIISKKLDIIIKLLGIQIVKDMNFREQVQLLYNTGLQPKEIAEITGKTENNIRVTLHLIKKPKKKAGQNEY
jgi:hypothetical protein